MKYVGFVLVFLFLFAVISVLMAFVFMLLWNGVVANMFAAPVLSFNAAWGIWVLLCMVAGLFRGAVEVKK